MAQQEISFSDLIASSIHDMKNSVNLQVNALERIALQRQAAGDSATCDDLGHIIFQTQRMNQNLVELLTLYKIGKSIYPVDMTEQSVAELIAEAAQQNQTMFTFKGIALSVDCAADCYWYMDRELVKGVLLNALNNAYRHTTDHIHIRAHISQQRLELRVEDNGAGFSARLLAQGDQVAERAVNFDNGNTGLGFYFSQQVAALHRNGERRGMLRIENGGSLGGGCFVLSLP